MTTAPYQAGAVPISNLPALPGIALSSFDELAIVDVDANETKKIAAEAFLQGALALLGGIVNHQCTCFNGKSFVYSMDLQ